MQHPTDRIVHTTTFVTPVVEHWLERVLVHHEGTIRRPIAPRTDGLPRSYISLLEIERLEYFEVQNKY